MKKLICVALILAATASSQAALVSAAEFPNYSRKALGVSTSYINNYYPPKVVSTSTSYINNYYTPEVVPTISASYINNYYTLKVGHTIILTGSSYMVTSGSLYANVELQGNMVLVKAQRPGTIVVCAYNSNGTLRTVNAITISY